MRIFTGGTYFCHEVSFRMYLPLALEVCTRLFIDNLGFMAVDEITKKLLGLTPIYSPRLSFQNEGHPNSWKPRV